jgi:FkbM family methyltransferase
MTTRSIGIIVNSNHYPEKDIWFFVQDMNDIIQRHHMSGRFYEEEELAIIGRHFRDGGVFVDVGANIGNHSIYLAKFLGASHCIPIEPNPEALTILRINIRLNGLTNIVDQRHLGIGFANQESQANIVYPQTNNLGAARLSVEERGAFKVRRGDDVLREYNQIDFIKIDVEGMEMAVLSGLSMCIAKSKPNIFIEVEDRRFNELASWAESQGYIIADKYQRYKWITNYLLIPHI